MSIYLKQKSHLDKIILKDEIIEYKKLLKDYKITFGDLTSSCPKDIKTRQKSIQLAKLIVENEKFVDYIKDEKRLPVKKIKKIVSDGRKVLQYYDKYILAIALIYMGEYTGIKKYLEIS